MAGIRQEEESERLIKEREVRSTTSLALIHCIDLASLDPLREERREGTNEAILETISSRVVAGGRR